MDDQGSHTCNKNSFARVFRGEDVHRHVMQAYTIGTGAIRRAYDVPELKPDFVNATRTLPGSRHVASFVVYVLMVVPLHMRIEPG